MGIIDTVKDVAKLAQEAGRLDLHQKAIDLMSQVVTLANEKFELAQELAALKAQIKLKTEMTFRDNVYWQDSGRDKGPFCPRCFDVEGKAVHVHASNLNRVSSWDCFACKGHYHRH